MELLVGPAAQIVFGLGLLIGGGELLVRGAAYLANALRISPLVIGLTVVAFGTSSPELAVSLKSAFAGNADIALGNVVGSNIINVLCILGLSAIVTPLVVSSQLIRREVPLMVAASIALLLLSLDGNVSRIDGLILFGGLVAYVVWSVRTSRRDNLQVQSEFEHGAFQPTKTRMKGSVMLAQVGTIIGGLALLGLGSNWLVSGAVTVAIHVGLSELVIGLTIVALGTSLPEFVTSVMAAYRGEREIAVGNVVGSNLFNILCVLGLSGVISPDGIAVSRTALRFDIPVMIAVAVACLPIFFTGNLIARWEGWVFFLYYLAYTTYLILDNVNRDYSRTLTPVMVGFVFPLTVVTILISLFRSIRSGTAEKNNAQPQDSDHD